MNIRIRTSLLLVLLLAASSTHAQNWTPAFDKFTLSNGLEVILHRDSTQPLVSVHAAYRAGSAVDPRGKTGLAHIAGEMLMMGTKRVPRTELLALHKDHNAAIQAQTGVDWVNLATTVPMNLLETAIMIEADRMLNAEHAVTKENFENITKRMRDLTEKRGKEVLGTLTQAIYNEIYGEKHPYRHITTGVPEQLAGITLTDVRNHVRNYFVPTNASLCIGGNFDPAQARALVEKYFGRIAPGKSGKWVNVSDAFTPLGQGAMVHEDLLSYNQLILVFPTVRSSNADEPALRLLASALAGSSNALMQRVLSRRNPAVRSVQASQSSQELAGTFWITVTCRAETRLQPIFDEVMGMLAAVARDGFPEEDLVPARNAMTMNFLSPLESFHGFGGRCDLLNLGNLMSGTPLYSFTQLAAAQAKGTADMRRVAARYLNPQNQLIISVLPHGKTAQAVSVQ